jgi:hypothetical protein
MPEAGGSDLAQRVEQLGGFHHFDNIQGAVHIFTVYGNKNTNGRQTRRRADQTDRQTDFNLTSTVLYIFSHLKSFPVTTQNFFVSLLLFRALGRSHSEKLDQKFSHGFFDPKLSLAFNLCCRSGIRCLLDPRI